MTTMVTMRGRVLVFLVVPLVIGGAGIGVWLFVPDDDRATDESERVTPTLARPAFAARAAALAEADGTWSWPGAEATADEIMAALNELATSDPAAALDRAHELGRSEAERDAWVGDLAARWAMRDPRGAWAWLARQTAARLRVLATGELPTVMIGAMAGHDPGLLVAQIDALVLAGEGPLGVAPVVAVHLGVEALVERGQLELARRTVEGWVADAGRPAIGEAAYVNVANGLAVEGSPGDAAAWLMALPTSPERDVALIEYPAHWAASAPQAALDWIAQTLPAEVRVAALGRSFGDWAERDAVAAGEWLGEYLARAPHAIEADRLIGALIRVGPVFADDPELALRWCALLADPAERRAHERRILEARAAERP